MALSSYVFVINSKYVVEPDNFNTPTHTQAGIHNTLNQMMKSQAPHSLRPPLILPHSTCLTALMHILIQN